MAGSMEMEPLSRVSVIGDAPKRREDARFVTGGGNYLDDLVFDGLAQAVVLRSPHAHAWMRGIDTKAARALPGVLAVLTADDAAADGLQPMRPTAEANAQTGEPFAFAPQPLLATDKVRYVGEAVALIVAATRAQALDAAERVAVDYDPLPAVTTAAAAIAPGAPVLSEQVPGNVCLDWHTGDAAAVDAAFARAAHVVDAGARQSPHRHQSDGAARRHRTIRSGAGPLHADPLQPEHPRQPRHDGARIERAVQPGALHRSGCRRRLRCEELRLCRIRAAALGGEAGRPAGEMDRHARRSIPAPTTRPATRWRRRRWRSMRRGVSWRCASAASPISAAIWQAWAAACRPTSTCTCPARSMRYRRSPCTSARC